MQAKLSITDSLTPALARTARKLGDTRPIMEAIGLQFVSITTRAFNDASLRPAPWAPLKGATLAAKVRAGKSTALLKRNVVLARSFRVVTVTNRSVTVGSDRPYASIHQWGAPKAKIPARPMMPLLGGPDQATLVPFARLKLEAIGRAKLAALLGLKGP